MKNITHYKASELAQNRNTCPVVLHALIMLDKIEFFLRAKPNLAPYTLAFLAHSSNVNRRYSAVIHPNTPIDIIYKLACDTDDDVRKKALLRI